MATSGNRPVSEPPAGTHPTGEQADAIVLASCNQQFPNATFGDKIGGLYPLPDQRSSFVDRVVDNAKNKGFKMPSGKVPTGDDNTLGDVSDAVAANAVA